MMRIRRVPLPTTMFLRSGLLAFSLIFSLSLPVLAKEEAPSPNPDPLNASAQLRPYEWNAGQGGELEIKMELPPGFHAYSDSLKVQILEPDGFQTATPRIEPQTEWFDKFSKKKRLGIQKTSALKIHIEAPARFEKRFELMKIELTYQACSEQFCLFPTKKIIHAQMKVAGEITGETIQAPTGKTTPAPEMPFWDVAQWGHFLEGNILIGMLFVFIAGLLTSFTPCIFPMIPITLAVLGNHAQNRSRLQNFLLSLVYVLGIATTYSILGLIAASSGSLFGAGLGNSYVLAFLCLIFLSMALSMYGLYEIQVPAYIRNRFGVGKSKGGFTGAYITGLFAGIVASPCVGPVLVSILTFVATSKSLLLGFVYLFTYAMGLGMIFIVLGLSNQLFQKLPRSGMWMNTFKFFLGSLMLSAFYYYFSLLVSDRVFDIGFGLGLIALGSIYGAFTKGKSPLQHLQKGLMLGTLFIGIGYVALGVFDLRGHLHQRMISDAPLNKIQSFAWKTYSEEEMKKAIADKRPVMIDFWAEWCAACHELEEQTFTDVRVRALAENFTLLKFDATSTTPLLKELKAKYKIQGLPTILFFDREGRLLEPLTLTQFEKAPAFVQRLEKALP